MRFFLQQPWLLAPEAHTAMVHAVRSYPNSPQIAVSQPLLTVENGIGIITIEGPLIRKPDKISQSLLGATNTEEIIAVVNEAAERPEIKAVLLEIDSPGGSVNGIPELAQAIADLSKSKYVYAFSPGWLCSAAYWIASQCDAIYVTASARVGSIGVLLPIVDTSESLNRAGFRVEVFSAGKYKSTGTPGVPLTDEQRAWLQTGVEEIAADFYQAVLARGRKIPPEALEGQTFSARRAMQFNLCGMLKNRNEAITILRKRHAS